MNTCSKELLKLAEKVNKDTDKFAFKKLHDNNFI